MRDDSPNGVAGESTQLSAIERLQNSAGRALALAIVASVLCLGMVGLFVFGVRPAIAPLVIFAVIMGVAALMNWARFVYLRRQPK